MKKTESRRKRRRLAPSGTDSEEFRWTPAQYQELEKVCDDFYERNGREATPAEVKAALRFAMSADRIRDAVRKWGRETFHRPRHDVNAPSRKKRTLEECQAFEERMRHLAHRLWDALHADPVPAETSKVKTSGLEELDKWTAQNYRNWVTAWLLQGHIPAVRKDDHQWSKICTD